MIVPLESTPFGTKTVWLFAVVSFVTNICISLTVAIIPCASIKSPTLNGLKRIINMPPAKLDKDPCRDKPTAKPMAPKIATNEEVSIPSLEIKVTNNNTLSTQSKISARNLEIVGSTSLLIIIFLINLLINLIIYNPKNKIRNAEISLGE